MPQASTLPLLKKHRQQFDKFEIEVDATQSEGGHPKVFTGAKLTFSVTGEVEPKVLLESVAASQTGFCGVFAMLSRAFPISYDVRVDGSVVGSSNADFESG